jgi:uncharacterized membrane protein
MAHVNFFPNEDHMKIDAPINNLNLLEEKRLKQSQRLAERVVRFLGSWKFIIIQTSILGVWVLLNLIGLTQHWDPYPFILMNLFLSMQAAYTAPIIMMSQNRQAERDRLEAHNDYLINKKAEQEICTVLNQLNTQNEKIEALHRLLLDLKKSL